MYRAKSTENGRKTQKELKFENLKQPFALKLKLRFIQSKVYFRKRTNIRLPAVLVSSSSLPRLWSPNWFLVLSGQTFCSFFVKLNLPAKIKPEKNESFLYIPFSCTRIESLSIAF